MQNNKVTIVVPVYNAAKYLEQCLDSVINQTYRNLEIICVNDGSTDKSRSILKRYAIEDSRIAILDKGNGGLSSARNFALNAITGEYVMYLDSDDWIDLDAIEVMLTTIKEHNADSIMCSYVREYSNRSLKTDIFDSDCVIFEGESMKENFYRRLFGPVGQELKRPDRIDAPISACMQLFKKDVAVSSKFVDTKLIGTFEDGLYQIEIYDKCHKVVYINKHFYHYRKTNSTSLTSVYRPQLFERWNCLYDMLLTKITNRPSHNLYNEALSNRIAIYFAYLCLNEAANQCSFFEKSKRIKTFLKTKVYSNALKTLSIKWMSFKWKVFFALAKARITFGLVTIANYVNHAKEKLA